LCCCDARPAWTRPCPVCQAGVVCFPVRVAGAPAAAGIFFRSRFESDPPRIVLSMKADVIGTGPLEIVVTDAGTGLKSVTATLSQGCPEQTLASAQYAQPAREKPIPVAPTQVPSI